MSCTCGTGYCEDHPPMPTRTNKAKPMNDKLCTMHGSKYVPVVLHGRQVWHCPECVKQNNPMSDKHQEAAEALFDSWLYGDNPENTMLIQDIASALRQVAQEKEVDARRYRWLRDPSSDVALVIDKISKTYVGAHNEIINDYEYRSGDELDAAIDAAMTEDKTHG